MAEEIDRFATCRCDACQEIRRLRQENERLRENQFSTPNNLRDQIDAEIAPLSIYGSETRHAVVAAVMDVLRRNRRD